MAEDTKLPSPSERAAAKKAAATPSPDWSKYAECSQRANVKTNFEAGVYDRAEGHLEKDLAALPLASS